MFSSQNKPRRVINRIFPYSLWTPERLLCESANSVSSGIHIVCDRNCWKCKRKKKSICNRLNCQTCTLPKKQILQFRHLELHSVTDNSVKSNCFLTLFVFTELHKMGITWTLCLGYYNHHRHEREHCVSVIYRQWALTQVRTLSSCLLLFDVLLTLQLTPTIQAIGVCCSAPLCQATAPSFKLRLNFLPEGYLSALLSTYCKVIRRHINIPSTGCTTTQYSHEKCPISEQREYMWVYSSGYLSGMWSRGFQTTGFLSHVWFDQTCPSHAMEKH